MKKRIILLLTFVLIMAMPIHVFGESYNPKDITGSSEYVTKTEYEKLVTESKDIDSLNDFKEFTTKNESVKLTNKQEKAINKNIDPEIVDSLVDEKIEIIGKKINNLGYIDSSDVDAVQTEDGYIYEKEFDLGDGVKGTFTLEDGKDPTAIDIIGSQLKNIFVDEVYGITWEGSTIWKEKGNRRVTYTYKLTYNTGHAYVVLVNRYKITSNSNLLERESECESYLKSSVGTSTWSNGTDPKNIIKTAKAVGKYIGVQSKFTRTSTVGGVINGQSTYQVSSYVMLAGKTTNGAHVRHGFEQKKL